jgi:NTE family protein
MGVLSALAATDTCSADAADILVGTSAGSVLAALVGARVAPGVMVQTLIGGPVPSGPEDVAGTDLPDVVHSALSNIPRPVPLPGNLRLAARALALRRARSIRTAAAALTPRGRGDLTPVGNLVAEFCGDPGWATRPRTWMVAIDFDSGRRVVFGAPGEPVVPLAQAVMASCSVPGLFPPLTIGDRRYIDGAAGSVTNADLLATEHLDEVVVVAPMAMRDHDPRRSALARLDHRLRQHATQRLRWEVGRLAESGTSVRVFAPTAEDLSAMGTNLCDASRRATVFETAVRTTTSLLAADVGVA